MKKLLIATVALFVLSGIVYAFTAGLETAQVDSTSYTAIDVHKLVIGHSGSDKQVYIHYKRKVLEDIDSSGVSIWSYPEEEQILGLNLTESNQFLTSAIKTALIARIQLTLRTKGIIGNNDTIGE